MSGKRKVLDEDTYTDAISDIIKRDFFPDLDKLQLQADWLEAVETGDVVRMQQIKTLASHGKLAGRQGGRVAGGVGASQFTPQLMSFSTYSTPAFHTPALANHHVLPGADDGGGAPEDGKPDTRGMSLDTFLHKHTSEDNAAFDKLHAADVDSHRARYSSLSLSLLSLFALLN